MDDCAKSYQADSTLSLLPDTLGMQKEQAMRRLHLAGAVVSIVCISSRKGVPNADQTRVIRQRVLQRQPLSVELTVSDFQTRPTETLETP